MLLQIMMIRLAPFFVLKLCRDRRMLKLSCVVMVLVFAGLFLFAAAAVMRREGIAGILYVFAGIFPHGVCYMFALWMISRCVWKEWSQRVWRRIRKVAFACVLLGIVMESYLNPKVLQFFCKIF